MKVKILPEYFIFVKDSDSEEESLEEVKTKVYPFEYQGISLFTFKDRFNRWNVTEKSTGLRLTYGETKSEAEEKSINFINENGISMVKERIKQILEKIKIEKTPEETTWEESLA